VTVAKLVIKAGEFTAEIIELEVQEIASTFSARITTSTPVT